MHTVPRLTTKGISSSPSTTPFCSQKTIGWGENSHSLLRGDVECTLHCAIEYRRGCVEQLLPALDGHRTRPSFTMPAHPLAASSCPCVARPRTACTGWNPALLFNHDAPAPATFRGPLGGPGSSDSLFASPAPSATRHPGFMAFGVRVSRPLSGLE
jgi:hypothetical protein